jgi:hypothetical protein
MQYVKELGLLEATVDALYGLAPQVAQQKARRTIVQLEDLLAHLGRP